MAVLLGQPFEYYGYGQDVAALDFKFAHYDYCGNIVCTSVKIIKNEVGCRDDTVPKTVDTRRHCEEE